MIDLGQIRDVDTLRDIVVYTFAGETMKDANGNVVTADPIVSDAMKGKTVMCQYYGIRLILTAYSEAGNGYPGTCVFASLVHDETGNGTNEMHWLQYYSSDGVNFQWREGYYPLQKKLVSGTNIKTVNGNSLLGSGDLSLSGKIFQGVTYSASSETTKVVTINTPANTTFEDGDLLFLRFYNDVAASVTGTIVSIGSKTYGIAYRNYGLQAAGVIKAGDNVLLHCFGGYAIIIAIDRWGADIASKQDALPPVANNAGKVLAVNNTANGLEWVAQSAGTEEVFVCSYDATTGTMDKTTSEISQASNDGKCVLCVSENDIYVLVSNNILTFSRTLGEQTTYITYNQSTDKWTKGSVSLQQSLVSGTNIKKVDNTTILGPGNLYTGRFFSAVQEASISDTFVLSYRTFRVLHIANGITSTSLSVVITQYDAFIIYDNSDNSSDVDVSIVTTNAIFYYKQGSDQFTIPAGKAAKVMFIRISSRVLLEVENNLDVAKNITTE